MTSSRTIQVRPQQILVAGWPFAKALGVGLLLTWLTSVVLEVAPASASDSSLTSDANTRAYEVVATPVEPTMGLEQARPPQQVDYTTIPHTGFGFGPMAPTLRVLTRTATPIAADSPKAEAHSEEGKARTYVLAGDIGGEMVLDLEAAIKAGYRAFTVSSRGGEMLAARAMAGMLDRSGATLVAQGQCHSACAYLWLAVHNHRLASNVNLAIHASYNNQGISNYGELWLMEMDRADLAPFARSMELHQLSPAELRI
jgi:hypothetical protein